MTPQLFLHGVPEHYIRARMAKAGGDEIGSGKFGHPESSAALAANALGWFVPRPELFPPLPGVENAGPTLRVEIEYCARFPWSGGTHPWLDAALFTATHLIGVESKRHEPFRDRKVAHFSSAYDQPVWGDRMARYSAVRDELRSGVLAYRHLDAAQLVKHAYGLVTDGRRLGLRPSLFYLFAESKARCGEIIEPSDHARHREELQDFACRVAGDEVEFSSASYREWLLACTEPVAEHVAAVMSAYNP